MGVTTKCVKIEVTTSFVKIKVNNGEVLYRAFPHNAQSILSLIIDMTDQEPCFDFISAS